MNNNLIAAGIGTLLSISAIVPAPIAESPDLLPSAQSADEGRVTVGNLQISTIPGNQWIQVTDYSYVPRIPPTLDLSGYPVNMPLQAVVWDRDGQCVGRVTDEAGQLHFIFVEADPAMCSGNLPAPAPLQNPTVEARG